VVSLRVNATDRDGIVCRGRVRVSGDPVGIGPVPVCILPPFPRTPGAVRHVTARTVKQDMGAVMVVHNASCKERLLHSIIAQPRTALLRIT